MTAIAAQLERKLKQWRPETARKVERLVTEIIELADQEPISKKPIHKSKRSWKNDPFFADKKVFQGKTPKDLVAHHDDYLYGGHST
jgi:hypothetical protein